MSKVLITGADGFIGSHLAETLVRKGFDVRAFVLYNSHNSWGWLDQSSPEIKNQIDVFAGDIRDPHGVKSAMLGCDIVFHLAALIAIPYSYHSPGTYIETNVRGTLNVVQAAKELGLSKVIHTSTSEVYGKAHFLPITEKHPLQGQSPYSASKIGADQIAMSFYNSFETPISIIRPFNTYGPRQSTRAVIPTIITQIARGKRKLELGALNPTRDFNYVDDTVEGFIEIANSEVSVGEVINIGNNYEISIGDTVKLIAEVMKADIEIESENKRLRPEKSEIYRLWCENSKAKEILNWQPQFQGREGLKKGLRKTIEWFSVKENLQLYKQGYTL